MERKGNTIEAGTTPKSPQKDSAEETPLGIALLRVVRAALFEERPVPELDVLPLAQLRLLWTVHYAADATMKDFSELLSVSQSTLTQLADRLVRRGLIERSHDSEDRRIVRLHPTELGRAALSKAEAQQRQTMRALWDALTAEQKQEVLHGLEILGAQAEAFRAAEGRPLPPLHALPSAVDSSAEGAESAQTQAVVDLMARRVRGRMPTL